MSDCAAFMAPETTCRISLGCDDTFAILTSPVSPSNATQSPSRSVWLPMVTDRPCSSILSSPAPTIDGLPICRPTTAACEVMPPVAVRMPCDTHMPWMSSGTVSRRTRITGLPWLAHSTAWSAVNTTCPQAAPGEAGSPRVATGMPFHSFGSKPGASSCDSASGSTSSSASFGVISRSLTRSVAMITAA